MFVSANRMAELCDIFPASSKIRRKNKIEKGPKQMVSLPRALDGVPLMLLQATMVAPTLTVLRLESEPASRPE